MKKRYILIPAALGIGGALLGGALMVYPAIVHTMHDINVLDTFVQMSPQQKQEAANSVLERKCVMCHTSNAKAIPILDSLSGGLLTADIQGAQRSLLIEGDPETRRPLIDLLKMDHVLRTRRMPPSQYTMVHWGSELSDADEIALRVLYPEEQAKKLMYQRVAEAPSPTESQQLKIELGHRLYFDTRLSIDNTLSCASCHDLTKGGTDQSEKSAGVYKDGKAQYGGVNAPTVFNAASHIKQFWDGRAKNLKEQAGGPPLNPVEMGYSTPEDWKQIGNKLAQDPTLAELFSKVYGQTGITADTITDAIASFEETLRTPNSPFDCYLAGDTNALTSEQQRGMKSFETAGCVNCHAGETLGGQSFEYIHTFANMRETAGNCDDDAARGRKEFTQNPLHEDMFRVPTLRNIALSHPYFHTGKTKDLREAVHIMVKTQCPDKLSETEITELTHFLEAQTGQYKGKPLTDLIPEEVQAPTILP